MAFDFTGKKVLVTGAGRGLGRGIATALAEAGCKVYALDCIQESLDLLAAENSNIVTILQDLSNWDETRATLEKLEVLDGLVNNAHVLLGFCPALEQTKEDLEKCMSVNLFAGINCVQVIGKKMIEEGRKGSVVNIASQVSLKAFPGLFRYSVSKAGVDMVTKQFALELGPHNIRVNSVNPTMIATDMTSNAATEEKTRLAEIHVERTPLGRNAAVEDIVGPVMYLLSDYSAMVTGTTHLVDGGIACNITIKQ